MNRNHASMCCGLEAPVRRRDAVKMHDDAAASEDDCDTTDDFVLLPSGDQPRTSRKLVHTIVRAGLLIPGRGTPTKDSALVVKDKLIIWVGTQDAIPQEYLDTARKQYSVPYLMPGLWDCHIHCVMSSAEELYWPAYYPMMADHPASVGARLARGCWETLQYGYTSIRDLAGMGCEIAGAINDGTIAGPNIYSCGGALSQIAGHGDIFSLPAGDLLLNFGVSQPRGGHFGTSPLCIVDGVDECRRGVRLQIRRGAKCIKVLASGGIMSSDDNPLYAQFSPDELSVIVEEATRMERAVAAHVHGKPGILAAVRAGVTTVEHVSCADEECVKLIKEKGVVYVATASVVQGLVDTGGEGVPKKIWDKLKLVAATHARAYKLAIAEGCTIALGTDAPPGVSSFAKEIEWAVKHGLTNLQALEAATANGPLTLGKQAPKTGQLKVGYEADMIGITMNPVEDVKVLQDRENIKWVWKGGRIYKGPGVGPWGEDTRWNDQW